MFNRIKRIQLLRQIRQAEQQQNQTRHQAEDCAQTDIQSTPLCMNSINHLLDTHH
jgi:hypothetical protein